MLLESKKAVIYGGGGSIGGAVARILLAKGRTYSSPVVPTRSSRR